jgi:tetratricopeptide (TPR) repeat protein
LLGRGGFSRVYSAHREEDGREVALKVALGPHTGRFAREAACLRHVGPPTVPQLLQEGCAGGRPYLVLEHLRGQTLASWMASLPGSGAASLPHVSELLRALCAALEDVHQRGVVHRDLKPENLFLREGGALALLDFGLARFLDSPGEEGPTPEHVTRTGQRLGTPLYMAPEQCLEAREAGTGADLYALGVLLFELLTGSPPFTGGADAVRHGHVSLRPPRASERGPVPPAFDEVLARCLAKNPAERFASPAELLAAFDAACHAVSPAPAPPAPALTPVPSLGGLRPVALLGVRSRAPLDSLLAAISPQGGALARVHAATYLFTFPEHLSLGPGLRVAATAARRLPEASAVLHAAALLVHPGAVRTRVAGAALESPESWWPARLPDAGIHVTPGAAAHLEPGLTRPGPEGGLVLAGDALSVTAESAAPLLGRDTLLEALGTEAASCLEGGTPGLCVLTGEVGHGKSRVLDGLASRLEAAGRVRVLRLRAPHPDVAAPEALLLALAECGDREETDTPSGPLAPGALRHARARAVAEALRRRARREPLALLLDDAHLADVTSLDALELATLAGTRAPLWVCVAGGPELTGLRPHLGERAGRASRQTVGPLDAGASRALLLHLLRPAELVPGPVLARLEQLAQGIALSLVELIGALRAVGALRVSQGGAWYVAPDALLDVSVTPLFERLAVRVLSELPAAHRGLAQLCAVLGSELTVARVDAAQRHLEAREDVAGVASLDAGAGLERLGRAGLLRSPAPGHFHFPHPLLREAIEGALPAAWKRALHAAALRSLEGSGAPELRRRARHAAACGVSEEAFQAYFTLAEQARRAHRSVEAEQHYTRALALLPEGDGPRRAQVLAGRGRSRHRIQRFREALADLGAARALAEALGDAALEVELLLEEATVRDWLEDLEGSAASTRAAMERQDALDDPRLSLRCLLARGRLHVRLAEWEPAVRVLSLTVEGAERARDAETLVVALVLLGSALIFLDRADEAAARFDEAISRCEASGDTLHLAAACSNRLLLWLKRGEVELAMGDLRRAIALSRELGHAQMERLSTFNLAELLHVSGRPGEALPLALRAHELGVRFVGEHPVATDALLVARIRADVGDVEGAERQLEWVATHCPAEGLPPATAVMRRLVELQVRRAREGAHSGHEDWEALVAEAAPCASDDERVEILVQAAQAALRAGHEDEARDWLGRAEHTAAGAPLWRPRLETLRARLLEAV